MKILYGEYQENIMTTTVNDIKFIDSINRNKPYLCKLKNKNFFFLNIFLTNLIAELIQFTENLAVINDNNNNNNNNYFITNQTINESIEHILPENEEKIAFTAKKKKENFPFISDFRMTKSKSQINFYKNSLNSPNLQSKLNKKKISFLLNSINNNNNNNKDNTKSSIIITSSSSGNIENSLHSLSNKSILKSKWFQKKSSKVTFSPCEEINFNNKNLLNVKQNMKNVN